MAVVSRGKVAEPRKVRPKRAYHHGNLKAVMIENAARFVAEFGPEKVTVREIARRAGVSSAAPFRHFPNKTALMTAVAEEAMQRLHAEVVTALSQETSSHPLVRLRAIGSGYLKWVLNNPAHFEVLSSRREIDFAGSATLARQDEEIQRLMAAPLVEAAERKLLRPGNINEIKLSARALAYGLARMYVDGHFPQWGVADDGVKRVMDAVLDQFANSLTADGAPLPRTSVSV